MLKLLCTVLGAAFALSAMAQANGGTAPAQGARLAAAGLMAECPSGQAPDFIDATPLELRRLRPQDCRIVADNPVSISWPQPRDRDLRQPWRLRLLDAKGETKAALELASPRVTLEQALPPGPYRWTVSYTDVRGKVRTSAVRQFQVAADTVPARLPTAAQLLTLLRARSAPRILPTGASWEAVAAAARTGDYAAPFSMLSKTADSAAQRPLPEAPEGRIQSMLGGEAEHARWLLGLMRLTNDEVRHVEALAFAWRFGGKPEHLAAAKARLLNLAAWDPEGASSQDSQPQANRNVMLALALGFDLLGTELGAEQRARLVRSLEARMAAEIRALARLDTEPFRSFENTAIHFTTRALLLVAGTPEFPGSADWLEKAWPLYLAQFQAFGGEDGGYSGSVAYAWYDLVVSSQSLATLMATVGVNLAQRAFVRRMGDFMIAMTAPDMPLLAAFGDGLEERELYRAYSADAYRLYAAVTRQPQHAWYWRQRPQNLAHLGYITPLHFMLLGNNLPPVTPRPPQRDDFEFADVGVVALHDHAESKSRSSVLFRSGRFGSYNHGHADQNSFTFVSHGTNLLINSGYYPYYLSPHHAGVTRATRYKNAVTFDGGIGQAEASADPTRPTRPVSSMSTSGKLVDMLSAPGVSVVTGDATLAYRGWDSDASAWRPLLSAAIRSAAFFKDAGVVVVYDWLASTTARRWEWNYHGISPFDIDGSVLVARNAQTRACITHHGPPGRYSTVNTFDIPPENGAPDQPHARYTAAASSTTAAMVAVIREDCREQPVTVTFDAGRAQVSVAGRTIIFQREAVELVR